LDIADQPFEPPNRTVFRVYGLTNVAESTLVQHSLRGDRVTKRVRSDNADAVPRTSVVDKRSSYFGCVAVTLMFWIDAVGNLDDALCRGAFEAAGSYGAAAVSMKHPKTMHPGVSARR